jgi:hypothetical protein
MGFKPMAFGLLAGDKPADVLKNAIGETSVVGKLYMDDEERRKKEEAQQAAANAAQAKSSEAPQGMKKGGSVKGWGIARGARKAKMY